MDDLAIYGTALNATDISNNYQAMFGGGPPILSIVQLNTNVVVSWPGGTGASWTLQTATQLSGTNWTAASSNSPAVFPIAGEQQFFRLQQQ
jgi:hypothetical protein